MFMRISWGKVKDGQWDEYERRYVADTGAGGPRPDKKWLVRDLDDPNAGYSISLWANEADMRTYASDPDIRKNVEETYGDLFTGTYETRHCSVRQSG